MNSLRSDIFFSDPFFGPLNGSYFLCGVQGQRQRQTALPAEFSWVYIASLARGLVRFLRYGLWPTQDEREFSDGDLVTGGMGFSEGSLVSGLMNEI